VSIPEIVLPVRHSDQVKITCENWWIWSISNDASSRKNSGYTYGCCFSKKKTWRCVDCIWIEVRFLGGSLWWREKADWN